MQPNQTKVATNEKKSKGLCLKWTVTVISSDLPFIKMHVLFTTVSFKPLIGQR